MTRALRIEYEGAIYHVLSRGNERKRIFSDDKDRQYFLNLLEEYSKRFDIETHAYVLMDNHYHLLVKTRRPNLSKSMQWLGVTYTRRFNIRHKRSGHLFQGRYKSILIENDSYLMSLSCYIHRNPLRARTVKRLADYKWSSYPTYAYDKQSYEWLFTDCILSQFNAKDKHKAYREMVQNYSKEEKNIWEDFRHGLFFGTQTFVDRIKSKYLSKSPNVEVPQIRQVLRGDNIKAILTKASSALKCDISDLRHPKKSKRFNNIDKRDLLIYLIWDMGMYNNQEIGRLFGLGYSSVSRRVSIMKTRLLDDVIIKKIFNEAKSRIKM